MGDRRYRAEYTYTWTDVYAECDGFNVVADVVLTVDETVFYDQAGDWTKVDLNGKVAAPVHRDDGVGPGLLEKDSFRNVFTPDDPDGYGVGIGWNLTVPGYGWVYKLTGGYTWDPITGIDYEATGLNATPLDGTAPGAQVALCDYFG